MHGTKPAELIVLVTGPLADDAVRHWGHLIDDAARMRPHHLIVDLRAADHIDEAAVVMLLQTHRRMTITDGRLALRNPNARVRAMLRHGRVDRILDIEQEPPASVKGST